ncbi:MAG: hypothetical protein AAF468_10330 [Pseudomonadota bacterium]
MEFFWATIFGLEFILFGCLAHVVRATFNPFPDRISDSNTVNILFSSGYSMGDHIFGTEYDDLTGYYRLDSLKNLQLSVYFSLIFGFVCVLGIPGIWDLFVAGNQWLGEWVVMRLGEAVADPWSFR